MVLATGCSYHKITINKKSYGNLNLRYQTVFIYGSVPYIYSIYCHFTTHVYGSVSYIYSIHRYFTTIF